MDTVRFYQMGCELGKHWAARDASQEQLLLVREFGDGSDWVAAQQEPGAEFTRIVDPAKSGFLGLDERPSASFVAGFIHGAQVMERSATD